MKDFIPITIKPIDEQILIKDLATQAHKIQELQAAEMEERSKSINNYLKAQYEAEKASKNDISIWSIGWFLITNAPNILKLIYQLLKVLAMNEDKKTTVMATAKVICGILALALSIFHIDLSADMQETLVGLAGSGYLVFSWLQGLFTNKKTEAK